MAWVRGQERFVYKRVFDHVKDLMLVELGWNGAALAGALPYGATSAMTIRDLPPDTRLNSQAIVPNAVAFTEGLMPDDSDIEIGGGLQETRHTLFIDIYGESISIAKAIASDIRSILTGRVPGSRRALFLPDYREPAQSFLPGHMLTFEDIEVAFPDGLSQQNWAVVKVTVVHEWNP